MAYIGAEPVPGQNREVDDISSGFNGNATAFTLQVNSVNVSPESAKNILVNLGGVLQNPDTDYTINASTLTFTTAPASGLSFFGLILGAGINTATVADGAITTAKLASDAVGANQLANTSVTAGSYTTADITVDAQGRITAAASGTISGAEIADQAVTNAKVNNSAAIAGTKISPDFGSQAIATTGSATIGTDLIHAGDTDTKISFGTDSISLTTNNVTRMTFTGNFIDLPDAGTLRLGNSNDLQISHGSGGASNIVHSNTSQPLKISATGAGNIAFLTNSNERMRVDSSGRLLIGHTTSTPMDNDANNPIFAVEGTGNGARIAVRSDDSTAGNGAFIYLTRTRGTSVGSKTTVQSGDSLGGLIFMGADGTHDTRAAIIQAACDGTPGDNDMPGRLEFYTTPDGGLNSTQKMVIKSTGHVGINVSDPQAKLQVNDTNPVVAEFYRSNGSTNDEARIALGAKSGNIPSQRGVLLTAVNTGAGHNFSIRTSNTASAGPTEKVRIKNDGNTVLDSGGRNFAHIAQLTSCHDGSRFGLGIHNTNGGGGSQISIRFHRNDTDVGSITTTGSATAYNTSSDYRLKENAVAISDGITRLKTLKPYRFNWKSDSSTTVDGFFAHEVTAVPEAITGTKDAVATEDEPLKNIKKDDPIYQSIDQSKLVPLLTAALQEAVAKIETLETKVAALEAA